MKLSTIIAVLLLLLPLVIIFFYWWVNSGFDGTDNTAIYFMSIGRLSGLLAVYAILLQVLLRVRMKPLEKAIGFAVLNTVHKKNGYVVYALILLHPIFLILGYTLASGVSILEQFYLMIFTYTGVLKAFISVLLFTGIVISSIYMVRLKLPYELWYFIHLSTYVAILFAWEHQLELGSDFQTDSMFVYFWYALYTVVFGSFIYWRVIVLAYKFYAHQFSIKNVVQETQDTYSIYIGGKALSQFQYIPGLFAFVRVLNAYNWWESHPFSFSQAPGKNTLRLTVKNSGDFTSGISDLRKNTPVLIDGPHGDFTLAKSRSERIVMIAGGVGITPIRAMLENTAGKSVTLLYSNRSRDDVIFKKELDALARKQRFEIHYFLTRDGRSKSRRITLDSIQKTVPDFRNSDIYICGPVRMVEALTRELQNELPSERIHTEVFAL